EGLAAREEDPRRLGVAREDGAPGGARVGETGRDAHALAGEADRGGEERREGERATARVEVEDARDDRRDRDRARPVEALVGVVAVHVGPRRGGRDFSCIQGFDVARPSVVDEEEAAAAEPRGLWARD